MVPTYGNKTKDDQKQLFIPNIHSIQIMSYLHIKMLFKLIQ